MPIGTVRGKIKQKLYNQMIEEGWKDKSIDILAKDGDTGRQYTKPFVILEKGSKTAYFERTPWYMWAMEVGVIIPLTGGFIEKWGEVQELEPGEPIIIPANVPYRLTPIDVLETGRPLEILSVCC